MSTIFSTFFAQPQSDRHMAYKRWIDYLEQWENSPVGVIVDSQTPENIKTIMAGINAQIVLHNKYLRILPRPSQREAKTFKEVIKALAVFLTIYVEQAPKFPFTAEKDLFTRVMVYKTKTTEAITSHMNKRRSR